MRNNQEPDFEEQEYKQRLYQTMEDAGLIDNVRVQIRQKLLDKLKHPPKIKQVKLDEMLVKKICSSLIIDYMNFNQQNYSLSVFQPECGYSNSFLSGNQLAGMLRLDKYQGSVLETLIQGALPKRARQTVTSTYQQTDDSNSIQNIERRLNSIELSYKNNPNSLQLMKMMQGREEREVKFKNQLNKRYKEDMEREIRRVRQFEIMNIRLQERDKYNIQMKEYKQELDQQYKQRLEKLRDREEDVMRRVSQKIKNLQNHSFDQRQKILKDMEYIKLKERELQNFKESLQAREKILEKQLKT